MNILFLTRNLSDYIDYTCWNSWVNILKKRADVKFYGPWFEGYKDHLGINEIIWKLYETGMPDILFYYNLYGWSGQHSGIEKLGIPKVVFAQNGIAFFAVPDMIEWINRIKFTIKGASSRNG